MESEESRGEPMEDQEAADGDMGEEEEATRKVVREELHDSVDEEDGGTFKLDDEDLENEDGELEAASADNNNKTGDQAEETEEEAVSDSREEVENKEGGEEEGIVSMEEVEGQPLDGNLEEEEDDDDELIKDAEQNREESMEDVEEEEDEENGERPGAMPEEEEDQAEIDQDEGQLSQKSTMSTSGVQTRKRTLSHSSTEDGPKRKVGRSAVSAGVIAQSSDGQKHDGFCWVCHRDMVQVNCKVCPRSYHIRCMNTDYPNAKIGQGDAPCPCPECVVVMNAETINFRSEAMKQLTIDQLMGLLKNICLRMRQTPGSDPFIQPVDPNDAEDYFDYIVYPMDIETLEKNIIKRVYGSTEGFLADAQWLVHNSIVFNSASSTYTLAAKRLLKVCKQELTEIETCPECYTNAHEKPDSWFVEACRRPHILVWAKLKGFPFWPAKAMRMKDNDVDVRFFGQHDRAWVAKKDCYLYSEEMPAPPPKKNGPLLAAIEELTAHVEKLKEVHGPVVFAAAKTQIGPQLSLDQIRKMLPEYSPPGGSSSSGTSQVATASAGGSTKAAVTASASSKPSNNSNNNNNNSVNKVAPPTKKSPMTIRISSLKTNPTIVSVSGDTSTGNEGRVVTRLTRKSSAATQQSNNPSGDSDQDHSEEQKASESNKAEDEGENVPEDEKRQNQESAEEEEEEVEPATTSTTATATTSATSVASAQSSLPKGSEILASALGGGVGGALRRSTRGLSRSGDVSESTAATTGTLPQVSAAPQLEKRLTRGALKTTTPSEDGNNGNESVSDEQPSEAVLEAMGLSKKTKDTPAPVSLLQKTTRTIKEEPMDTDGDMEEMDTIPSRVMKATGHNTLMEQLTMPTSGKPGYRFNLSKDISISAVDGAGLVDQEEQLNAAVSRSVAQPPRRLVPGGQQRSVPQGIPMNAVRPRLPVNTAVNGQQGRVFTGQQLRQMVRNARPQHILNPRTGQIVRSTGATPGTGGSGNRAVTMLPVRGQQQQFHVQQPKTSKDSSLVVDSSSLVNPVQGPITLPGGTITVTPLTSLIAGVPIATFDGVNGSAAGQTQQVVALKTNPSGSATNIGIINVQQQTGGATTVVNTKGVKTQGGSGILANAQQRRNLMVSIPPSVNMHLQNLTKTMGDLVKSTVEQITLEIVEFCNNAQGKAENSRLQVEVEKLQKQLKQEVTDIKHNHDIAMRELRMTLENDKKRALQELKRQTELDKQKAIEETKKKQWCASCGREALFYCCWNTSYCGYPCQEEHWPTHMASCSQSSNSGR